MNYDPLILVVVLCPVIVIGAFILLHLLVRAYDYARGQVNIHLGKYPLPPFSADTAARLKFINLNLSELEKIPTASRSDSIKRYEDLLHAAAADPSDLNISELFIVRATILSSRKQNV
jgi:hypothetical protein